MFLNNLLTTFMGDSVLFENGMLWPNSKKS